MSGKIVGEVLDASARLKESGLPERAYHALVAIAEKCHTDTRQGSVRWDHIRAGLYGSSKRTAERAVAELKNAGLVTVVRVGFNNNRGRACAPIYAISTLTDTDTAMTQSVGSDTDRAMTDTGGTDTAKPVTDTAKPGTDTDTQVSYLTVLYDGSTDGRERAADADASHSLLISDDETIIDAELVDDEPDDPEPPLFCSEHMPFGTGDKCAGCKVARKHWERWGERNQAVLMAQLMANLNDHPGPTTAEKRRAAIDDCDRCDATGRYQFTNHRGIEVPTTCDHNPAVAQEVI